MRIKSALRLCQKYKAAQIVTRNTQDEETEQWLSVRGNVYPLEGVPFLDKEALLTLMDVPEDKKNEYSVGEIPTTKHFEECTDNWAEDDQPAKKAW